MWLEKRRPAGDATGRRAGAYFWMGRLTLGVCMGLVVATAVAIAAGRHAHGLVQPAFWATWGVMTLVPFVVRRASGLLHRASYGTALVLVATCALDAGTSTIRTPLTLWADVVMVILALCIVLLARVAPRLIDRSKPN